MTRARTHRDDAFGIFDERFQAVQPPPRARRITGHRDHAGVEAAKQRLDIFQSRRIEETHPCTRFHLSLQERGRAARAPVQFPVGQRCLFGFSVRKVGERTPLRFSNCSLAQQVDESQCM